MLLLDVTNVLTFLNHEIPKNGLYIFLFYQGV